MDIEALLTAVGGRENIRTIEDELTRIRLGVNDRNFIDEQAIRNLGAYGVVIQKEAVQLILGREAVEIAAKLAQLGAEQSGN
ncbi:glucose-like phosphotransferase system IIB component [Trueperella bonasi]|uniref:Glucose-like phosphotransferase system IIB component n=1 Tax=Trueperella bonasi TaxID=312286 RepID=A0ABT9NHJ8_9ACTO|nr:PTS transporter subunit EIIB [Trueperella bonasi]MDP9806873.1 glucose-like phosphotransferase system IIB component [Trueperella bonasi]